MATASGAGAVTGTSQPASVIANPMRSPTSSQTAQPCSSSAAVRVT